MLGIINFIVNICIFALLIWMAVMVKEIYDTLKRYQDLFPDGPSGPVDKGPIGPISLKEKDDTVEYFSQFKGFSDPSPMTPVETLKYMEPKSMILKEPLSVRTKQSFVPKTEVSNIAKSVNPISYEDTNGFLPNELLSDRNRVSAEPAKRKLSISRQELKFTAPKSEVTSVKLNSMPVKSFSETDDPFFMPIEG